MYGAPGSSSPMLPRTPTPSPSLTPMSCTAGSPILSSSWHPRLPAHLIPDAPGSPMPVFPGLLGYPVPRCPLSPHEFPVPGRCQVLPGSPLLLLSAPCRPSSPGKAKARRKEDGFSPPGRAGPGRGRTGTATGPRRDLFPPGPPWLPSATSCDGVCGAPAAEVRGGKGAGRCRSRCR